MRFAVAKPSKTGDRTQNPERESLQFPHSEASQVAQQPGYQYDASASGNHVVNIDRPLSQRSVHSTPRSHKMLVVWTLLFLIFVGFSLLVLTANAFNHRKRAWAFHL
jgi:hypothetical protein